MDEYKLALGESSGLNEASPSPHHTHTMQLIPKLLALVAILAASAIATPTAQLESDLGCQHSVIGLSCIIPREVV